MIRRVAHPEQLGNFGNSPEGFRGDRLTASAVTRSGSVANVAAFTRGAPTMPSPKMMLWIAAISLATQVALAKYAQSKT